MLGILFRGIRDPQLNREKYINEDENVYRYAVRGVKRKKKMLWKLRSTLRYSERKKERDREEREKGLREKE